MPSQRFTQLYENYTTTHAGLKDRDGEIRVLRRDVLPHLPKSPLADMAILDLGCGQGAMVGSLTGAGYAGTVGVDISDEQIAFAHSAGITSAVLGDYRDVLRSRKWHAVLAMDFVEHLDSEEVLELFDHVRDALLPGGVFIIRVPNNTSPFAGNYQFGDFTHKTAMTPRSFSQVAKTARYAAVSTFGCPPIAHGLRSWVRATIWRLASAGLKIVLTAETGATGQIVTQNFVGVARRA